MIGDFEPIAVYDIRDRWWMNEPDGHDRLLDWVRSYGVDPTYSRRFEVYLIDCPSLRVFDLALDENGRTYRDGAGMALRDPYDVPLADLPPGCPRAAESDSHDVQTPGHQDSPERPPAAPTATHAPQPETTPHPRNEAP